MNSLWLLVRTAYVLGLIPAVLLFVISVANYGHNDDVGVPLMILTGLYIAASWLVFWTFPNFLSNRLKLYVRKEIEKGFRPRWELESASLRKYVGFDNEHRRVLFLDVGTKTAEQFSFDELRAWEMETFKDKPAVLKLQTSLEHRPVITLAFDRRLVDIWRVYLEMIFSSERSVQFWR